MFERHEPDAVMHLAAESHVDRSIDGPEAFLQTNVVGTGRLLQARAITGDRLPSTSAPRFVSARLDRRGVRRLGAPTTRFHRDDAVRAELAVLRDQGGVRSPGARLERTYGLPVIITNCSNNYGPYQFPEKLIPLMILNALDGKPLPVYGDGRTVRDWLYVEDHARALWTRARRADASARPTTSAATTNSATSTSCDDLRAARELAPASPRAVDRL